MYYYLEYNIYFNMWFMINIKWFMWFSKAYWMNNIFLEGIINIYFSKKKKQIYK